MKEYSITPVPKPRQTRSDRWRQRPCVMRYRAFADKVRAAKITIPEAGAHIVFIMPMPKSWSLRKKDTMDGNPCKQKKRNDIDNLAKSLFDSVAEDDSYIYDVRLSKFWGRKGKIIIK